MLPSDPSAVLFDGPWRHRDVSANGIRLHLAESGDGPLVLLLHGFAGFWWSWHRCLPGIAAAGHRTVAVDLRGYGSSDKPPRGYDGWTLAGDIAGLIRALGEGRAHLVGHDWGGMLAWATASLHPRVVASVTTLGAGHPLALRSQIVRTVLRRRERNQARGASELFRSQLPFLPERRLRRNDAAYVERLMTRWAGPSWPGHPHDPADAAAGTTLARHRTAMSVRSVPHTASEHHRWAVRSQLRGDGRRFARALAAPAHVPVLQIRGEHDECVLANTLRESARWAGRGSSLRTFPAVGHLPQLEAPDVTVATVTGFLRGIRPVSG